MLKREYGFLSKLLADYIRYHYLTEEEKEKITHIMEVFMNADEKTPIILDKYEIFLLTDAWAFYREKYYFKEWKLLGDMIKRSKGGKVV